jgi:DNA invertase Pin-like site-specific DNA recombinase
MNRCEQEPVALIPAVAYARMSTDAQNHSIGHQLDSIHAYAENHGLAIQRVFLDEGRSGLTLGNRPGLQALLAAATSATCDFTVIVVYDISRWGRFQDVDESAFYLCRRAGVVVVYSAEQFLDDGSPLSAIMKGIKRAMAAEYSRELSVKVHAAQCRFSMMGYKQGGRPGYGLRRLPVAVGGQTRMALAPGERKPAPTDRVALVPGRPEEVEMVRRIYRWYIEDGWGDSDIARQLRSQGGKTHMGIPWDAATVRRILTNERYCGQMLFNQTTRRMRGRVARNPEGMWIRCDGALEPIVSRECFAQARRIREERAAGADREKILDALRALYLLHGTINIELCRKSPLPGRETILRLFGGYVNAYAAAGLPALRTENGALGIRSMRTLVEGMLTDVCDKAARAGGHVCKTPVWNILLLNDAIKLKISIASCRRYPDATRRWRVALRSGAQVDFVLCALMDTENVRIRCFLLLSTATAVKASLYLSERALVRYAAHCFTTLDEIFLKMPEAAAAQDGDVSAAE